MNSADRLAKVFKGYFDVIVLMPPCSQVKGCFKYLIPWIIEYRLSSHVPVSKEKFLEDADHAAEGGRFNSFRPGTLGH